MFLYLFDHLANKIPDMAEEVVWQEAESDNRIGVVTKRLLQLKVLEECCPLREINHHHLLWYGKFLMLYIKLLPSKKILKSSMLMRNENILFLVLKMLPINPLYIRKCLVPYIAISYGSACQEMMHMVSHWH